MTERNNIALQYPQSCRWRRSQALQMAKGELGLLADLENKFSAALVSFPLARRLNLTSRLCSADMVPTMVCDTIFAQFMKPCLLGFMKSSSNPIAANDANLQLQMPAQTKRAIAMKAADTGTPMRLLVLAALKEAGFPVPDDALVDRRKPQP